MAIDKASQVIFIYGRTRQQDFKKGQISYEYLQYFHIISLNLRHCNEFLIYLIKWFYKNQHLLQNSIKCAICESFLKSYHSQQSTNTIRYFKICSCPVNRIRYDHILNSSLRRFNTNYNTLDMSLDFFYNRQNDPNYGRGNRIKGFTGILFATVKE